jgi:hypothetical protein
VTNERHSLSGAPHTQNVDQSAQGSQPAQQNLLQVATKVSDLAARVDDLELKADLAQPEIVGTNPPAAGPTLLQDVLPEIKSLSEKVGGMDHLSKIVDALNQPKG